MGQGDVSYEQGDALRASVEVAALSSRPRLWLVWLLRIAVAVVLVGGWALLSRSSDYWRRIVSSPRAIFDQLRGWSTDGKFRDHVSTTLLEAALGYALGVGIALALVALVTSSRLVERFLAPFVTIAAVIPKLALAPMFIIWFGITLRSKVYFVAVAIFVIVFYSVSSGLKGIDNTLIDNQRALGANLRSRLTNIYFPSIVGWLMTSLRVSAAWALLAAVISEYLGSTEGLGFVISRGEAVLDSTVVISGILVVALVALVFDRLLVRVESRFSTWRLA